MNKKIVLSGAQPSGMLTIGNYLGALTQWKELQKDDDKIKFFGIVDLHAITSSNNIEKIRERTLNTMAIYLSIGLNPKKSILFLQSMIPEHTELMWYLLPYISYGDLNRMTQFKEKSNKSDLVNAGIFTYPCLMAADILLYQTDIVPVGEDQTQHLELTRTTAERFNTFYNKKCFKIPKKLSTTYCSRVMSLTNPTKKMSKSDIDQNSWIGLMDSPDVIRKKIQISKTDSLNKINYSQETQPGITNLIDIYTSMLDLNKEKAIEEISNLNYNSFKKLVSEAIIYKLTPFQEKYTTLRKDENLLIKTFKEGSLKAREIATKTIKTIKETIGII